MAAHDRLRGNLDLLLLAAVARGEAHGYALVERLRELSGGVFDLQEGTVYAALHGLERAGLFDARWTEAGGRRRKLYRLTRRGTRALAAEREAWTTFSGAVHAVMGEA